MARIYSTRSTFDIARDDALGISAFGCWYRHDATSFWVSVRGEPRLFEFSNAAAALRRFEVECDAADQRALLDAEQPD